jgi:hypothetical protein
MVSLDKVALSNATTVLDDSGTVALDDPGTVALDGNAAYRNVMQHIKAMTGMFLAKRKGVVLCSLPSH